MRYIIFMLLMLLVPLQASEKEKQLALEVANEDYKPSWLGWLKLPKTDKRKLKFSKSQKPDLWDQWRRKSFKHMKWIPPVLTKKETISATTFSFKLILDDTPEKIKKNKILSPLNKRILELNEGEGIPRKSRKRGKINAAP